MITTIFHEKWNTYHISEPTIGRFFPKPCACTFTWKQFHSSFSSAKKRCNTSQGFGAFFGQSCDRDRFLFPFTSDFPFFFHFLNLIAVSNAFLIIKTIILLIFAGYQIIITILALSTSLVIYHIWSAPSLYANLRVPTRIYDVEGGSIFSKNSTFVFFDGAAWILRLRSPSPIMAPGITPCWIPCFWREIACWPAL